MIKSSRTIQFVPHVQHRQRGCADEILRYDQKRICQECDTKEINNVAKVREIDKMLTDTTGKLKYLSNEETIEYVIQNGTILLNDLVKNNANPQAFRLLATVLEKANKVHNEDNERESPIRKFSYSVTKCVHTTVDWMTAKEERRMNVLRIIKKSGECETNNYLLDVSDNEQMEVPEDFDFHDHNEIKGENEAESEVSEEDDEYGETTDDNIGSETDPNNNDGKERKVIKRKRKSANNGTRKYPCGICGRKYASKSGLDNHMRQHLPDNDPKKRPFACDQCGKAFTLKFSLEEHKLMHLEDLNLRFAFPCSQCDKRFRSDRVLRKHLKFVHSTESKKRSFACNQCGNVFTAKRTLEAHVRVHLEDVNLSHPFPCDQCDKRFRTKAKLNFHVIVNHSSDGGRRYTCGECGKKYADSTSLRQHERQHLDDEEQRKPFKCEQCGKRFIQKASLKKHKETHNPIPANEKIMYQCEECGKKYTRQSNLNLHKKTHTNNGDHLRRVECHVCGKFVGPTSLKYHMQTHIAIVDRTTHKCETCGNVFVSRNGLTTHKALHCGVRSDQFKCGTCGKILADSRGLIKHERLHLDDEEQRKPFVCDQCGKRFVLNSTLIIHKRKSCTNTRDGQQLACDQCDKRFSFLFNLKWHKMWHLPDNDPQKKILKCEVCSKTFMLPCTLKRHMIRRHDLLNSKSTQKSSSMKKKNKRDGEESDDESIGDNSRESSTDDDDDDDDDGG